ncbi:DUF2752 domain-containing protein [Flavobacterium sp. K5-23]|uniref:DUF2752 domain-containing protein n=1 Tax=Flavobacterium sp. K5-23 TaxID=2746225 RepID=UPI0034CD5FC4
MLPCLSKTLFGMECLGCGFQRAFLLLLRGEFSAAFQMYPAIYSSLLFFGILGFHFFSKSVFSKKIFLWVTFLNVLIMILGYVYKHY